MSEFEAELTIRVTRFWEFYETKLHYALGFSISIGWVSAKDLIQKKFNSLHP
jgi:hypothetical protein